MKRVFISVLFSNSAAAGLAFAINLILARILPVAEFGRINLILTISMLLFSLADFGISNTIVVFYNRFKEQIGQKNFRYLLGLYKRYLLACSAAGIVSAVVLLRIYSLGFLEFSCILLTFLSFLIFRHANSIDQAAGNWRAYNTINVTNSLIKILAIVLTFLVLSMALGRSSAYDSILIGLMIYAFLSLFMVLWKNSLSGMKSTLTGDDGSFSQSISSIFVPLGIINLFIVMCMRFGSLVVEKMLGSEYLAMFSAANILAMVVPLITGSLMNVLIRDAAERGTAFLPKIFEKQKQYLKYLVAFFVLGVLLSKYVILILFGSAYLPAAEIFNILLVAYLGGMFFTPLESYFYGHDQKTIMHLRFYQMMIVVLGSIVTIPFFQLHGVAVCIVLSRVVGWTWIYCKAKSVMAGGAQC
jgi:O-antigen/teichoic acid export membrane protein